MGQGNGQNNLQAAENRIPELDGIRGMAIGLVLLGHFSLVVVTPSTSLAYALVPLRLYWSGVDLFFVLSGFLIGGILLDARTASNYFRVFYTRRFFRIVPIYGVLLVATVIVVRLSRAGYIGNYRELYTTMLPWPFFALFLQNIGMSIWHDYGTLPLGATWSLAVEEQFYLTLPLVIRLFSRRMLLRFIAAGVVAAPLVRTWFYHHDPVSFFPLLHAAAQPHGCPIAGGPCGSRNARAALEELVGRAPERLSIADGRPSHGGSAARLEIADTL